MSSSSSQWPPQHGGALLGYRGKCKYKSGRCANERTLKENGEPHTLCEPHRLQHNKNQRKSDIKRRRLKKLQAPSNASVQRLLHAESVERPTQATSVVHPITFTPPDAHLDAHHSTRRNDAHSAQHGEAYSDYSDSKMHSPGAQPAFNYSWTRPPPPGKMEMRRTIESPMLPPLHASMPYHNATSISAHPSADQWLPPIPQTSHVAIKQEPPDEAKPPPSAGLPDEWSHEDLVILTEMVGLQQSSSSASSRQSS
ncbi:hypothetical protein SPRG_19509 [Saprolegnia parasitica CBS 223.65]|uniref:Uncharacterized protein n=1 Tax=Saprolegnia parasitica (strain CBS 223.65) TaxID=695850 RepID=A0A067CYL0_SAPPC|nr:hypothetical protein SPRG_19509 [Saprolegnia parasitica CBS 223.65]KDO31606.1 hypothetical protein SPRG_19509 [Saprolegnia parasitica CBS 223.65]|eukprot:XP_012197763.1 hypothetical protein SPRG_19509 [Saprolegnia parasitica CBS 223.65]